MQLYVPMYDRRCATSPESASITGENGKEVGVVKYWGDGQRYIALFDEKYDGIFLSDKECVAFAKGVEAVLNHMISTGTAVVQAT